MSLNNVHGYDTLQSSSMQTGTYCLALQPLHHLALADFVPVSAQIQLCPSEVAVSYPILCSSLLDFAHAVVLT